MKESQSSTNSQKVPSQAGADRVFSANKETEKEQTSIDERQESDSGGFLQLTRKFFDKIFGDTP